MEQSKTLLHLDLNEILVEGRLREDLGDVEGLAEAIESDGLLQPIVVEATPNGPRPYQLIAGGRRYAAFTLLKTNKVEFQKIPCMLLGELPAHTRVKLELEENLRRKDMTWQEKVLGIYRYHKASQRAALLDGDTWSQQATGDLLGVDQSSVSNALRIAKELLAGNERVKNAESMSDAYKVLVGDKLDEAQQEILRRMQAKREASAKASVDTLLPTLPQSIVVRANEIVPAGEKPASKVSLEQISAFYHQGNALDLIPRIASLGPINHIVCDPPYGIDMDNLVSESVERIAETHQVEANLGLIESFLDISFKHIAPDGFLCMWYDLDHHEKIKTWAEKIGWRVQRWPLVWCKTSPCRNSQAQYNITKSTEVCYFLRRSEQSVLKKKQASNFVLAGSCSTPTHPFPKPPQVWNYIIDAVSLENQTLLDPFAGEGSSLAAMFNKKRVPIGIELDEKHIASGLSYIQDKINSNSLDELLAEPPL